MGWTIVQQPNKLFARFSEDFDDFTHYNMTENMVIHMIIQICVSKFELSRKVAERKLQEAKDNPDRWNKTISTIRNIHGEDWANNLIAELSTSVEADANTDNSAGSEIELARENKNDSRHIQRLRIQRLLGSGSVKELATEAARLIDCYIDDEDTALEPLSTALVLIEKICSK